MAINHLLNGMILQAPPTSCWATPKNCTIHKQPTKSNPAVSALGDGFKDCRDCHEKHQMMRGFTKKKYTPKKEHKTKKKTSPTLKSSQLICLLMRNKMSDEIFV